MYHALEEFHKNSLLSQIWDENQIKSVFKIRDTIQNTIRNTMDIPFDDRFHKQKLTQKVHSSNVDYDTIYYYYAADSVRNYYNPKKVEFTNNNLNNLSERLNQLNVTLLFLVPPDSSHMYEEYFKQPPYPKASRIYNDLKIAPKKYQYIDAYSLIKDEIHSGKLDLYPMGTTHWAPTVGADVANEIVKVMNNSTGIQNYAL